MALQSAEADGSDGCSCWLSVLLLLHDRAAVSPLTVHGGEVLGRHHTARRILQQTVADISDPRPCIVGRREFGEVRKQSYVAVRSTVAVHESLVHAVYLPYKQVL